MIREQGQQPRRGKASTAPRDSALADVVKDL